MGLVYLESRAILMLTIAQALNMAGKVWPGTFILDK